MVAVADSLSWLVETDVLSEYCDYGPTPSRGIGPSVRCQLLAQNPLNPLILTTASLFFRVLTRSFQMPSKLPFRPLSASATRCFAVQLTLKLETFAPA